MDIASVYLNLESLLGTEIEVEGYYDWAALYSIDYNRQSLNVTLPAYVGQFGLTDMNYAFGPSLWPEITVRGVLRQNHQGDPILDPIHSIVYGADHINYRATLVYEKDLITCEMCGDVVYNQARQSTRYITLKRPSFAYDLISKPLLLEALVTPPINEVLAGTVAEIMPKRPSATKFSISLYRLVRGPLDFAWQSFVILFYVCFMAPVIVLLNIKKIRSIHRTLWEIRPRYQSVIWLQDKENALLRGCLTRPSRPRQMAEWEGKVKFLFAGQLRVLSTQERKAGYIPNYHHVTFASLDFIRMSRTITFKRPQDE